MAVTQYLVVLFVFYQYIWVYFYMLISYLSIKVSYLKNKTEDSTKYIYSSLIWRTESKQPSATIQLWSVRIWTLLIRLFYLLDIWFPSHILTCLLWLPPQGECSWRLLKIQTLKSPFTQMVYSSTTTPTHVNFCFQGQEWAGGRMWSRANRKGYWEKGILGDTSVLQTQGSH